MGYIKLIFITRKDSLCDLEMRKFGGATNVKVRNHLPEELSFSILSKLPLKSLKRFGCVQKSWALLFDNLYFMSMYRNYFLSTNHSYYDGTSILLHGTCNPLPNNYHSLSYLLFGEKFENMVKLDLPPPLVEDGGFIEILSNTSVNGTLCLTQMTNTCVFWNPTTDEFKVLPSSPFLYQSSHTEPEVTYHGFGYDHVRDDYKVVRWISFYIITDDEEPWQEYLDFEPIWLLWEIYSLRSNSWRKLDIEMPFCWPVNKKLHLEGVCHWITQMDDKNTSDQESPRVVSFDLCNEVFLTTPLPSDIVESLDFMCLTLLNEAIAVIIYDETTTFQISILGELGVKESWTKIFNVEPLPCIASPIGIGKKGDIFFRNNDDEVVWFDSNTQIIKELGLKIGVKGRLDTCNIVIYKDSLLPIGGL